MENWEVGCAELTFEPGGSQPPEVHATASGVHLTSVQTAHRSVLQSKGDRPGASVMNVGLVNDGPVTWVDSGKGFLGMGAEGHGHVGGSISQTHSLVLFLRSIG